MAEMYRIYHKYLETLTAYHTCLNIYSSSFYDMLNDSKTV